ncbi:MAG: efflux RND transporter periplasmic adaptor subunit [Bacteroidota bacterium]
MKRANIHLMYLLLPLLVWLGGCSSDAPQQTEKVIRPVRYATVARSNEGQKRSFPGIAQSAVQSNLSFRASGLIESLAVKVGDRVRKGQLIATLDNRDAQLAYQQAKAALESARVQKENAQSSLTRVRQLYQSNNVSLAEYEQAKSSFSSASANLESSSSTLDLQRRQLSYAKILAPGSGVVTAVNNEVNEVVQAGAPIVVISQGKQIELKVGIPETYIGALKEGNTASVRFSAIPAKSYPAKVREVSFSTDQSQTYPVTVSLQENDDEVRPGMAGEVYFEFGQSGQDPLTMVPVKSVGEGPDGTFVFVIKDVQNQVGLVEKRSVQLGKIIQQNFVVKGGLEAGTMVATAGLSSLLDGMQVRLMDES